MRYIGLFFPDDPLHAPWPVIEHLAAQLGFEDAERSRRFRTFPHGRAWTHAEGPVALFNQAVG